VADKLMAEPKGPEMAVVIVEVLEPPPLVTLTVCGDALMVKFGVTPVTVRETVVVDVVLPAVPVTVIE
jgi:hypothetical protein